MKCYICKGLGFILDNGMYQGKIVTPWADRMYHACLRCHGSGYSEDGRNFDEEMIKMSDQDRIQKEIVETLE